VEESSRNSCSFIVEDSLNINKLCDIFKQYPLHTSKKLDFISFNEVVIIKANNKVLSETDIAKIISIKNSMRACALKERYSHMILRNLKSLL